MDYLSPEAGQSVPDQGNQSIDDLVDQVLQQVPEAVGTPTPAPMQWIGLEPEDHRELIALYSRIMAQYLEPISQLIGMVRCGERAQEALESFRDVMNPILLLTDTIRATEQAEIIRAFLTHIEALSRHRGPLTYRHLEPLNCLFDQLLQSLDPVVRDRYLATCFYQRNTNPLLEALRQIRFMGPRRLQRLYAVGLVTADSISRASAREIMEVSGLSLQLSQAVIDATRTFTEQQRKERVHRLRELCRELEAELSWFTSDGREQLREVWSDLTALTSMMERARALGGVLGTLASAPAPCIAYGTPASAPAPGLAFGTPASAPAPGIAFGTQVSAPAPGLAFGTPASAPAPGLAFGTQVSASAIGIPLGTPTTTPSREGELHE